MYIFVLHIRSQNVHISKGVFSMTTGIRVNPKRLEV